MTIIEVDGVYTEPAETDMIYLTAAQRYGVLVRTRNDSSSNFAMVGSMDTVSYVTSSQESTAKQSSGSV
jgi:iron transport multicopper oxidase